MARLKASEKYAKNPFAQQAIIHTVTGTRMIYSNPTGDSDRFAAVNKNTGENAGDLVIWSSGESRQDPLSQILCRRRANVSRAEKSRNQGFHGHLSTFA